MRVIVQPVGGAGDANHGQQLGGALAGLLVVHAQVQLERLGDLVADGQHRVQGGHWVLEDHGDLRPAQQTHLFRVELHQVPAAEYHRIGLDLAGRLGDQPHNREGVHTLAAAAFPHNAQGFALIQRVGDAIHGINRPLLRVKFGVEVLDLH